MGSPDSVDSRTPLSVHRRIFSRGITVLLVDDHPEDVRLLGEILRFSGAGVLLATDGLEALRLARDLRPSVILLDVNLPPSDGFDVCRQLRQFAATREIPVLFLSGRIEAEIKLQGFEAGGRDYITKPFIEAEVLARVNLHADLARRSETSGLSVPQESYPGDPPPWLFEALSLLHGQLDKFPKLSILAHKVGTNPRYLNEAFRIHLGNTVFGYFREYRLKEAHRLLLETSLTIQQIADRVGYSQPSNLTTAFRDRFGVSPRELRRETEDS